MQAALRHYREGRLVVAEKICVDMAAADPGSSQALHLAGVCAHSRGDHHTAEERIRRAIALAPDNLSFRLNLGHILLALGKTADAKSSYSYIVEQQPGHCEALLALGNLYHQASEYKNAIQCYQGVVELNPDNAHAQHNLGVSYQASGIVIVWMNR